MAVEPIDFAGLAAALLDRAYTIVPTWLPNGIRKGNRWHVGDFDGSPGESANVNLDTGQWIDNAAPDEDKGGDLTSLYGRIHGLNNGQAARKLMDEFGWRKSERTTPRGAVQTSASPPDEPPAASSESAPLPAKPRKGPKWRPIVPVPPHAPAPKFHWGYRDEKAGGQWVDLDAPVATWRYEFEGQLYGYVARFERVTSAGEIDKETIPFTWCEDLERQRGTQCWHSKTWEQPRPLYVPATILSGDLQLPVVIVEGEKCAEAGHKLLGHEFDFVTWPGGCKQWALAAWGWLMGRTVILWPDCDAQRTRLTKIEREEGIDPKTKPLLPEFKQPGMAAMVQIGSKLQADQGCAVSICRIPAPGAVGDGWDIADAIAQGWDADQVRAFIRGAVVFVSPNDEQRAKVGKPTPSNAGASEEEGAAGWRGKLITSGQGAIKPVRENVILAVDGTRRPDGSWMPGIPETVGVIAFNEFTNNVEKLKATPWGTKAGPWEEVDELELGDWLSREHWLPPMSRQTLEEAVKVVAFRHRYHPVRERFERLRGTWDGTKRCDIWVAHCCRAEGVPERRDPLHKYLARVGRWLLMAICARVMDPGCKFDYMVIFEGAQGLFKSTTATVLGMEWFADTGLVLGDKDSYQNLQGILVYEWSELQGLSKAEVTKVKQFISSRKDRFRASFDRRPRDYPRQVVFIGTTNETNYLTDPTGNRRMWPVQVNRPVDLAWLRANLDQLYAEALHLLDAGERFYPTHAEERELFTPQQEERTVDDGLEQSIRKFLYDESQRGDGIKVMNGSVVNEISLGDLLTCLGISVDKQTQALAKQASSALHRMGWLRARASGKGSKVRPWVFRRPLERGESARADGSAATDDDDGSTQSLATEGADDAPPF